MTVRYLTTDELIYINAQLTGNYLHQKTLQGRQRVRAMDLLETAAGRPMQTVFGADAYPTVRAKAAALLHSIARNHPFADGNKRAATVAAIFMLEANGLRVTWDPEEALLHILAMAAGRESVSAFARWLPTAPTRPALVADAERDMQLLQRIMAEHAWLLDELAQH
jgi:death on curing protein